MDESRNQSEEMAEVLKGGSIVLAFHPRGPEKRPKSILTLTKTNGETYSRYPTVGLCKDYPPTVRSSSIRFDNVVPPPLGQLIYASSETLSEHVCVCVRA